MKNNQNTDNVTYCQYIFKRTLKKGEKCCNKAQKNQNFCSKHKIKTPTTDTKIIINQTEQTIDEFIENNFLTYTPLYGSDSCLWSPQIVNY